MLLAETFPSSENTIERRLEAQNYRKAFNQHITEYFFEKLSRCNKVGMTTKETMEWILNGLNQRYRDFIGPLRFYNSVGDLLIDLKEACNVIEKNKEVSGNNIKKDTQEKRIKMFQVQ